MLVPHDMNGQTVGVLGLGGSGVAAVAALQAAGALFRLKLQGFQHRVSPHFRRFGSVCESLKNYWPVDAQTVHAYLAVCWYYV